MNCKSKNTVENPGYCVVIFTWTCVCVCVCVFLWVIIAYYFVCMCKWNKVNVYVKVHPQRVYFYRIVGNNVSDIPTVLSGKIFVYFCMCR